MMLDLTNEETDALARLLSRTIDDDRYPLSPPAYPDFEGHFSEDTPRTAARALADAEALRATARDYGKTTARWALTLDSRQQHYERQQPDHHPQGPLGRFADHLSVARRLSRSALAS